MKSISREEEYDLLKAICSTLYIARNITHSETLFEEALSLLDKWGRDENTN